MQSRLPSTALQKKTEDKKYAIFDMIATPLPPPKKHFSSFLRHFKLKIAKFVKK